jgi:hypothetical protein
LLKTVGSDSAIFKMPSKSSKAVKDARTHRRRRDFLKSADLGRGETLKLTQHDRYALFMRKLGQNLCQQGRLSLMVHQFERTRLSSRCFIDGLIVQLDLSVLSAAKRPTTIATQVERNLMNPCLEMFGPPQASDIRPRFHQGLLAGITCELFVTEKAVKESKEPKVPALGKNSKRLMTPLLRQYCELYIIHRLQ